MRTFHLEILAAEGAFFRGECESVSVPAMSGQIGIWAGHCNLVSALTPGRLTFRTAEGVQTALVGMGLVKVEDGSVLVLTDTAEREEDAEKNRVRRAEERAREEALQRKSMREYQAAQAALANAVKELHGLDRADKIQ